MPIAWAATWSADTPAWISEPDSRGWAPVKKLAGLSAGVSHGWASLKTRRSWSEAVDEGKDAAARRERDLEDELKAARGG